MAQQTQTFGRDLIAKAILVFSFIIIGILLFQLNQKENSDPEEAFNLMLPLISTWVGTILAFYFGKENFEAASRNYKEIIDKLSPEILDDVTVRQVMTDRDSIVALDIKEIESKPYDVKGLIDFLEPIKKSRLPILDNEGIKYIIHKSLLTAELASGTNPVLTFNDFVAKHKATIEKFGTVNEDDKIEAAQKLIKENHQSDIFVLGKDQKVKGWLTDTQIARYLTC
jgi:hypothetical protein